MTVISVDLHKRDGGGGHRREKNGIEQARSMHEKKLLRIKCKQLIELDPCAGHALYFRYTLNSEHWTM